MGNQTVFSMIKYIWSHECLFNGRNLIEISKFSETCKGGPRRRVYLLPPSLMRNDKVLLVYFFHATELTRCSIVSRNRPKAAPFRIGSVLGTSCRPSFNMSQRFCTALLGRLLNNPALIELSQVPSSDDTSSSDSCEEDEEERDEDTSPFAKRLRMEPTYECRNEILNILDDEKLVETFRFDKRSIMFIAGLWSVALRVAHVPSPFLFHLQAWSIPFYPRGWPKGSATWPLSTKSSWRCNISPQGIFRM